MGNSGVDKSIGTFSWGLLELGGSQTALPCR